MILPSEICHFSACLTELFLSPDTLLSYCQIVTPMWLISKVFHKNLLTFFSQKRCSAASFCWQIRNTFVHLLSFAINDIVSSRSVADHCDRISNLFFNKFNILSAVLRQFFVCLDSADITFPSRKCLQYRFCFSRRCVTGNSVVTSPLIS